LSEFASADALVHFSGNDGAETQPLKEMLPFQFHLDPR
jgi:cytidine deaminase